MSQLIHENIQRLAFSFHLLPDNERVVQGMITAGKVKQSFQDLHVVKSFNKNIVPMVLNC